MTSNLIIPVGGLGSRFVNQGFSKIKPLINIDGAPMLIASVNSLEFPVDNIYFAIRKFDGYLDLIKELESEYKNPNIYTFDTVTSGPATTVYNAIMHFNIDEEQQLFTANCDQIMKWSGMSFHTFCNTCDWFDGIVNTFEGGNEAHSFIKLDNHGHAVKLTEKVKISNTALTGIHFWRKAKYFCRSAEDMFMAKDTAPNGEYYISKSYNYMIKRKQIVGSYHIPVSSFWPVGTPEDLRKYLNEAREP